MNPPHQRQACLLMHIWITFLCKYFLANTSIDILRISLWTGCPDLFHVSLISGHWKVVEEHEPGQYEEITGLLDGYVFPVRAGIRVEDSENLQKTML